ncbi:cyclic pyranopterin monophosphate synthase MoaC [Polyangium aurulentum]|uniref:cyclic pyranopterin monophosphate synthase MoaC n=1 Tax=Polyangium aurulentum TaxID=2567896 RepID=UPI0010ADF295|nr:cyclic pyranopterin monophosphate synthase MoaC [Polyangium aurulentum]UQA55932.1 cyclic pyranopterin monophosphate synthase MoaC [Polyangium aurulentum]
MARAFSSVIYAFEEIGSDLDLVPIAARRALDHAGLRLSLEGWRSLPVEERRHIAVAGGTDTVDTSIVASAVRRARPQATQIPTGTDPSPRSPPDGLARLLTASGRTIDAKQWAALRALDRFALAHAHRRSTARNEPGILGTAFDEIVAAQTASAPTGKDSSSTRTKVSTDPPPAENPTSLSSHLGPSGEVRMVDVAPKAPTQRRAVATGTVRMRPETAARLVRGEVPKGEVLATARVAGVMAAKRTPELVPLCHTVALTHVTVQIEVSASAGTAVITATAEAVDRTGVEMEAMVAVSIASLTMYDMLKGIDREMTIDDVKLLEKSGGRSGHFRREP